MAGTVPDSARLTFLRNTAWPPRPLKLQPSVDIESLKVMNTSAPARLAGSEIQGSCHACAFFNSRDEEYRVLLPFAKEGLECGEKCFHIVDPGHRQERLSHLGQAGIDVDGVASSGQLEVKTWPDAYLRGQRFDQYAMLELIEETLREGKAGGYPRTRLWANMEWALEDLPGCDDIVEYESRLNPILAKYDDIVVCTYDLSKFSAGVVMDILRTHPMVVIGETVQENPFYVPPEKFLEELAHRAADK
jgi:hypothetical protein